MRRAETKRTLYVIAYDITSDRRRTKVYKALCGFGQWTQYSLFECYLDKKELLTLSNRLEELLNPKEDSVRFYPLCSACEDRVKTVGSELPAERRIFIV